MSKRLQILISGPDAEVSNAFVDGNVIRPNDPSKDMVLRNVEIRIVDFDPTPVPAFRNCWWAGPHFIQLSQDG